MPVLILENAKWIWSEEEIKIFRDLWEWSNDVKKIAKVMKEDPDDIALLVIDQAQKGKIKR